MTTAQEKFLRELAKELGCEVWRTVEEDIPMMRLYSKSKAIMAAEKVGWLITPDGMMYLIQRAKEERGLKEVRTYYYDDGVVEACLMQGVGTGPMFIGQADTEPWATALAVGKLFGVKMEDES